MGKTPKDWSYLVYIAGDNNLSKFGLKDISELEKVGSNQHTSIFVEFDSQGEFRGTVRFQIPQINPLTGIANRTILKLLKNTDSGDPHTLSDFLHYGKTLFPAKNYCVVIWNHGSGFRESDSSKRSRIVFRKSSAFQKIKKEQNARGIARDDMTGNALDMKELGSVLKKSGFVKENKIGLLGFDACLMNMVEVAYEMSPYAKFLVGSEDLEPGYGADYTANARSINKKGISPQQLTEEFVNNFHKYYSKPTMKREWPTTQSGIDLSHTNVLAKCINQFAKALLLYLPKHLMKISEIREEVQVYAPFDDFDDYVDIGDLANLCRDLHNKEVTKTANELLLSLKDVVVENKTHGKEVKYSTGITIWFPESQHKFKQHERPYKTLSFTKKYSNWMKFLSEYHIETRLQKRSIRKLSWYRTN